MLLPKSPISAFVDKHFVWIFQPLLYGEPFMNKDCTHMPIPHPTCASARLLEAYVTQCLNVPTF